MNELYEIIKDFNIENIGVLMIISFAIMSAVAKYIQLLYASQFETILMNKNDESKRLFFIYAMVFVIFCLVNYLLTFNAECLLVNMGIFVLVSIIYSILWGLNKIGKVKRVYRYINGTLHSVILMTLIAISIFMLSTMLEVNHFSLVILGTLVEVLGMAIFFLNTGNKRTFITVTIENETWYVFKRIDEKYLLCGDTCQIDESTKTKLLVIDKLVEKNICFERKDLKKTSK